MHFFPAGAAEQPVKKPFTIPEIMQWKSASGSFVLADNFRIVVPKKASSDLQNVAELLADDYAMFHGYRPQIVTGKSQPGDVVLKLGKNKTKTENYTVEVGKTVELSADARQGLYYATRTFLQLTEKSKEIPCGRVTDRPSYALRGFMIDCGRKFFPMSYLKNWCVSCLIIR